MIQSIGGGKRAVDLLYEHFQREFYENNRFTWWNELGINRNVLQNYQ